MTLKFTIPTQNARILAVGAYRPLRKRSARETGRNFTVVNDYYLWFDRSHR